MLRTSSSVIVHRIGYILLPIFFFIFLISSTHHYTQKYHAGIAHPYLDGSVYSTIKHVKTHGTSWLFSHFNSVKNDGWISIEGNEGWLWNWIQLFDDYGSTPVNENILGLEEAMDYSVGPIMGTVKMSAAKRKATARSIDELILKYKATWTIDYWHMARNNTIETLQHLSECLHSNTCTKTETTIVIGGSWNFGDFIRGGLAGEDIWARSVIEQVESLGHTMLYAYEPLENLMLYQAIPHLISNVLMEERALRICEGLGTPKLLTERDLSEFEGSTVLPYDEAMKIRKSMGMSTPARVEGEQWGWIWTAGVDEMEKKGCIKRIGFEEGIPIWKTFSFWFWPARAHPLGESWTVSPEDYSTHPRRRPDWRNNFFLGYSIESICRKIPIPPSYKKKDRVFVLGKEESYFGKELFAWWDDGNVNKTFHKIKHDIGVSFLGASGASADPFPDDGITNIGRQPPAKFYDELAHSNVLLGIGRPTISPTPRDALCLGVPFINPILEWDLENPTNRDQWDCQHNGLHHVREPYVYHVFSHDIKGLERAIQKARKTPIGRFISPDMTTEATRQRTKTLINLDWKYLYKLQMLRIRHEEEFKPWLA